MAEDTKTGKDLTAPTGKIQKGSAKDAGASLGQATVDAGEKNNRVVVNPALGGNLEIPEVGEDGELTSEIFVAGKTHLVDDETAALEVEGVSAFVDAPEKKQNQE
jgi:hypothetical protein